MQRREFIQALGAGIGLATLAGCASLGSSGSKAKVVVIGGGYGGATAAKYLRMWSNQSVEVTLVEPNADFISCPMSNLVLAGVRKLNG